ncbi:shikimate kinase, chloroplastic-like [Cynara cardunculus var. scolymus]|uniref:shikimate kinase, chloroplastic-like n=1 Tax=Cynara cardunculus var. scolymus TaxID=59895 RepID=UPI000D63114F|nr:shikimate kinase, chloroplastic-like [Cynara cardunculus var. scolymus]
MEAKVSQSLRLTTWISSDNAVPTVSNSMRLCTRFEKKKRLNMLKCNHLGTIKPAIGHRQAGLKASCTSQNSPASLVESGTFTSEEDLVLKKKSKEIEPYLNGRCIYLVGMMGSGKTTIGQILSEVLDYSFFDSDKLIEQAAGGTAVADIFRLHGESFFRDNETEVLHKLSLMRRLVISTGGGAVVRPINWKYMHKGISIFIDVPLDALAQRITAIGTASRPLLHHGSGDAYVQTFKRLSMLWEERSEAYTNARVRVSLERIAAKLGQADVCSVTPTQIAIEALVQIEEHLKE